MPIDIQHVYCFDLFYGYEITNQQNVSPSATIRM